MEIEFSPSRTTSMSDDVRELMKALLLAEADFPTLEQTGFNPQFKSKNSKLPDYYKAVTASLRKNNIKIVHFRTISTPDEAIITTRLIHALSGQWMQDMAVLKSEKPGNQGLGAALTYMLKDAIRSLCAVSYNEKDDDGQEEDEYIQEESIKYITGEQLHVLQRLLKGHANSAEMYKEILARSECKELHQILKVHFDKIKQYIEETKQAPEVK